MIRLWSIWSFKKRIFLTFQSTKREGVGQYGASVQEVFQPAQVFGHHGASKEVFQPAKPRESDWPPLFRGVALMKDTIEISSVLPSFWGTHRLRSNTHFKSAAQKEGLVQPLKGNQKREGVGHYGASREVYRPAQGVGHERSFKLGKFSDLPI